VTSASRRFTLSTQILIGLTAGIGLGLLVGERASVLQVLADGYVKLLQMTVLPYVTISLLSGLGSLRLDQAKVLAWRCGAIVLGLWAVALTAVFLFPLTFPRVETASFFSTTLLDGREPFDFVGLYIPSNPFASLANNVVPAVVLFSIIVGVALIAVPGKERLIDVLQLAGAAVSKATALIVRLTPYGLFAVAAVAAGTLGPEDFQRIQVYLVAYIAIALFLSLWVLPGLVAALTAIPYRAVLNRTRDPLITAFMTGSLFIVLPALAEQTKALMREYGGGPYDPALADVIVPASFNFPHTGKLLAISFVLFAGWSADAAVPVSQYPRLAATGLLVLFGNVNGAVPFLLDTFHIPADTFQLFLATGLINARFGTLVAAVHTLTVGLLGTCAIAGLWQVSARKLLRYGAVTAALAVVTVASTRAIAARAAVGDYHADRALMAMAPLRAYPAASALGGGEAIRLASAPGPAAADRIGRIRYRGVLRVGYLPDSLPFAFVNTRGDLVGLDVEMAHALANELGVALEMTAIPRADLAADLDAGGHDLVMSGVAITTDRAAQMAFSASYLDETLAFIVPDHQREAFASWSAIRSQGRLRVGAPPLPAYIARIQRELPEAELVPIAAADEVFVGKTLAFDAVVLTAERGSAWTLLHPQYSVAVPAPTPIRVPLAYPIAGHDEALTRLVNTWIELKRKDGTIDALFAHWILGRDAAVHQPRWSVIRNLLHWVA
jgi:Na+/H+-dicarboxylate symporter/ABC-type amino acid transport substrate-binding protein